MTSMFDHGDDGLDRIALSCGNCNRESHFLGVFCWWGVWMSLPVLVAALSAIGYIVWVLVRRVAA